MWAKLAVFYNRAKSANSAFSLFERIWRLFAVVFGSAMLAWASSTWNWYWVTYSWAGVAFAFLVSWIGFALGFFVISLARHVWRSGSFWNSKASLEMQPAAALDFVKNISIYTDSPDTPALFRGTASKNLERIKIFLDYSVYFKSVTHAGWTQPSRVVLAAFEPFEKEIRYEATVVSRIENIIAWGNNPGDKDTIYGQKNRARLVFAALEKEQYFYFMVVPTCMPDGRRSVVIMNKNDFSFQQEWEEHDTI